MSIQQNYTQNGKLNSFMWCEWRRNYQTNDALEFVIEVISQKRLSETSFMVSYR